MNNHLIAHSSEWDEYARTGNIEASITGYSLNDNIVDVIRRTVDNALFTLIKRTCEGDAKRFIEDFYKNTISNVSSKMLLDALIEKYDISTVENVAEVWNKLVPMTKKGIEERINWVIDVAEKVFLPSEFDLAFYHSSSNDVRISFEQNKRYKKDVFCACFLMAMSPEYQKQCLDFHGMEQSITFDQVVSRMRRETKPTSETAMIATKKWIRNNSNQHKKKGNFKCYVCSGNHHVKECPTLKERIPNAHVFKQPAEQLGQSEKPSQPSQSAQGSQGHPAAQSSHRTQSTGANAWFATVPGQGVGHLGFVAYDSTNIEFDAVALFTRAKEAEISKLDWLFDSGTTIHVCNEREKFQDLSSTYGGTISGVAGKVPIKGYGTINVGKFTFHDVAYVP